MSAPETQKPRASESSDSFIDPIRDRRVPVGFVLLLALLVPVWPLSGTLWGVPSWAVFSVFAGLLTSIFIAWVVLFVWRDSDKHSE